MPVRSKRLVFRAGIPTTFTAVYTAPSGETVIVKEVVFTNRSSGTRNFWLFLTSGASSGHYVNLQGVAVNTVVRIPCWLVLKAGDVLSSDCSGNNCDLFVSGTELEGEAD